MKYPVKELRARLAEIPPEPGVYIFKARGVPVYVGKAASLPKRIASYLNQRPGADPKTSAMVRRADTLEVILTRTEADALLLEANLIKKYSPKYNLELRGYPFVKITRETYPQITVTRETPGRQARFLGPFTDATNLRRNVYVVNRAFGLRTCRYNLDARGPERPCLDYEMGLCVGPCAGAVGPAEYNRLVDDAVLFVLGKRAEIFRDLEDRMRKASSELRFEDAAKFRDMIKALREVAKGQVAVTGRKVDRDALVHRVVGEEVYYVLMKVREGQLIDKFNAVTGAPAGDHLEAFILNHYSADGDIPPVLLVRGPIEDKRAVEEYLSRLRSAPVSVERPSKGWTARLLKTAEKNLDFFIEFKTLESLRRGEFNRALEELAKICGAAGRKTRVIEMIDISNIGPYSAVGGLVTLSDGVMDKSRYRRYRIKSARCQDDFAAVGEVVKRRFSRIAAGLEDAPDLFVVDGGRGHLSAVTAAVAGLGISGQAVAALAKGEPDVLYVPGRSAPAPVSARALLVLARARDEAHRFALAYHRKLRRRRTICSFLDGIPGIGPKRKRALLSHFGSVDALARASADEIAAVPGMTRPAADAAFAWFRGGGEVRDDE